MAAALVLCAGLGYLVDDWLGTSPAFVLIGVLLGVAAAVGQAVITVRRYL
jgi:F0F1-type ATP synthase assembly protein I